MSPLRPNGEKATPIGAVVVRQGRIIARAYNQVELLKDATAHAEMLAVTQADFGDRTLLRPGDYFGEVALAMDMPRTATVTAMTPSVVASCDRETFDELIRPIFADD